MLARLARLSPRFSTLSALNHGSYRVLRTEYYSIQDEEFYKATTECLVLSIRSLCSRTDCSWRILRL